MSVFFKVLLGLGFTLMSMTASSVTLTGVSTQFNPGDSLDEGLNPVTFGCLKGEITTTDLRTTESFLGSPVNGFFLEKTLPGDRWLHPVIRLIIDLSLADDISSINDRSMTYGLRLFASESSIPYSGSEECGPIVVTKSYEGLEFFVNLNLRFHNFNDRDTFNRLFDPKTSMYGLVGALKKLNHLLQQSYVVEISILQRGGAHSGLKDLLRAIGYDSYFELSSDNLQILENILYKIDSYLSDPTQLRAQIYSPDGSVKEENLALLAIDISASNKTLGHEDFLDWVRTRSDIYKAESRLRYIRNIHTQAKSTDFKVIDRIDNALSSLSKWSSKCTRLAAACSSGYQSLDQNIHQLIKSIIWKPVFLDYCLASSVTGEQLRTLNELKRISQVEDCTRLESWLRHINTLDLSELNLVDISPLRALNQLDVLDLSGNHIRDTEAIGSLSRIRQLDLSKNSVRSIDLTSLIDLYKIDLSGNQIDSRSKVIFGKPIYFMNIVDNPISDIDRKNWKVSVLWDKPTDVCEGYLDRLYKNGRLNESQLNFGLGNSLVPVFLGIFRVKDWQPCEDRYTDLMGFLN